MITERNRRIRIGLHAVIGVVVIALGLVFLLDNFAVIHAGDITRYWPAVFIVLGALMALQADRRGGRVWGVTLAVIGLLMVLRRMDLIAFSLWDLWPLVLVAIGASMLWRGGGRRKLFVAGPAATDDSFVAGTAVLGGFARRVVSKDFRGGEVTAVMGGAELDLRQAEMRSAFAELHVVAFWGGVEIRVPREWSVQLDGLPVLGGFEDKTMPPQGAAPPRLVVKGVAVMGGVEVTN
jgi:predicted membrane protein